MTKARSSNVVLKADSNHLHVGVVLALHQPASYWLPPEDACLHSLLQAYPSDFRLAHRDPDTWVYDVVSTPDGP